MISSSSPTETIIRADSGTEMVNFKEIAAYRELFFFLVWRDIKTRYAQSVMGFSWAILNPVIQIAVFTIIFGKVAQLDTGGVPYLLFSTVAIIPWSYMSEAMSTSSQSLVGNSGMLGKIYFPREIYPLTSLLAKLVDFALSLVVLVAVMVYYKVTPTWNFLYLPVFLLMMIALPAAVGFWLSSLAIRFRDVRFALPFVIRMLVYSAPIIYAVDNVPEAYRFIYSINPIVGVIEGFRACLLGTDVPWELVVPGMVTTILMLVSGLWYFKRMEKVIVDVI